jgi:hypothetical protein
MEVTLVGRFEGKRRMASGSGARVHEAEGGRAPGGT